MSKPIKSVALLAATEARLSEKKRQEGRYTLEEAAQVLAAEAGESVDGMLKKFMAAAEGGALPVYAPGKNARYLYGSGHASCVREFYEEVYWNDVNAWLEKNEPRIEFRFANPKDLEQMRAQEAIGFYDATMHARHWFGMAAVAPKEAAMLLCRLNPLSPQGLEQETLYVDGDRSSPERYRLLLRAFEDVARTSPQHRTLMDWRDIAQERSLDYHPWIDEYVEAMGSVSEIAATEVQPATGRDAAQPVIGPLCTKKEIIDGFILTAKKWGDILTRPDREGRRYREAFKQPGRRGQGNAALWSPIIMARLLIANRELNAGQVKTRFVKAWPNWEAEMLAEIGEV